MKPSNLPPGVTDRMIEEQAAPKEALEVFEDIEKHIGAALDTVRSEDLDETPLSEFDSATLSGYEVTLSAMLAGIQGTIARLKEEEL